jgi:3-deoxy-7-phosphoheptulonate synthase
MENLETFLPFPSELKKKIPLSSKNTYFLKKVDSELKAIHTHQSKKKLLILGPCSIHHLEKTIEYAYLLKELKETVKDQFLILMRVHVEKPRTLNSWKGFISDPTLDGQAKIEEGIESTRRLMRRILDLELPISAELLDPLLFPYYQDFLSFAVIGARTIHSQVHRLIASTLPFPVGFKNRIDGDIQSAIDAMQVSKTAQTFVQLTDDGRLVKTSSVGNFHPFLILRGGSEPNYFQKNIESTAQSMKKQGLIGNIIVDCAHGNKKKLPQERVVQEVIDDYFSYQTKIQGLMIESYLKKGNYTESPLTLAPKDLSITDECLSFEETKDLVLDFQSKLIKSNQSLCLYSAIGSPSNVINSAL